MTSAFTEADIDVELYIEQFEGFKDPDPKKANWVRRLYKGLYGAKQAGRRFFLKARGDLKSLGFRTSALDQCVYILERPGKRPVLLGLFVDDFFVSCDEDALRVRLYKLMSKYFELQDLGWLRDCLGIRFTQDIDNGVTKMDQVDYVKEKILDEHKFDKCLHPVATPFYGKPLPPPEEHIEDDSDPMTQEEYLKLCGKLIWIASQTRPDIAYAVHQACRFLRNAGPSHKENLRRIVRYLRGSPKLALFFTAEDSGRRQGPLVAADQLSQIGGLIL